MNFIITILGSSSALPTPSKFSTAQVINILERFFLVDCGEGTQIQLQRYKIKVSRINHIFISHLHGDHFLGIFGLISSFNLHNRNNPLHIHGPFKLKNLIDSFIETMDHKINYQIIFHALHYNGIETIFEDDKIKVESFPLRHRVPTCGFLFTEKPRKQNLRGDVLKELNVPIKDIESLRNGADYLAPDGTIYPNKILTYDPPKPRSYAFVSDTMKKVQIVPIIKEVDLLYHEATYVHKDKKRAKDTGHSTALQAAEIAQLANVKKLIIGHFSNRYKNLDELLEEAQSVFQNTELAMDGKEFKIPLHE